MIIKNGNVFEKDGSFHQRDVYTDGSLILEKPVENDQEVIDARGLYVCPGFIDIHVHGAVGADVCDAKEEGLLAMGRFLKGQGVTSFCPTSMTYPEDLLTDIFSNCRKVADMGDPTSSRIVGINMEGPYVSASKKGAQNPDYIMNPDPGMFDRLMDVSGGLVRLVTLAPELPGADEFIESCKDKVHISLGHSACDYDTARRAFDKGADHVTHLYNAMHPMLHRNPGIPGAAGDCPHVCAELICDGIHVHPSMIRNTFRMLGPDRVAIISDSMRACGLADGLSELGGQKVFKQGAEARLEDGTIAGSVTPMTDGFRNAVRFGVPLETALKACTINPAASIGMKDRIGVIAPGAYADIILLNQDLELVKVL